MQSGVDTLPWDVFPGECLCCLVTHDYSSLSVSNSFSKINQAVLPSYICLEKLCFQHFFHFPNFSSSSAPQLNLDCFCMFCYTSSASLKQWPLRLCDRISFREIWWSSRLLPQFSRAFLRLKISLTDWQTERVPSCFPMFSVNAVLDTHDITALGARMSVCCHETEQP